MKEGMTGGGGRVMTDKRQAAFSTSAGETHVVAAFFILFLGFLCFEFGSSLLERRWRDIIMWQRLERRRFWRWVNKEKCKSRSLGKHSSYDICITFSRWWKKQGCVKVNPPE